MVQFIEDRAVAGDAPYIEFKVYRKPKDASVVFGYMKFFESSGVQSSIPARKPSATIATSNLGVPVDEAYRSTISYANQRGIPFLWIDDPRGLFPPGKRPTL